MTRTAERRAKDARALQRKMRIPKQRRKAEKLDGKYGENGGTKVMRGNRAYRGTYRIEGIIDRNHLLEEEAEEEIRLGYAQGTDYIPEEFHIDSGSSHTTTVSVTGGGIEWEE